MRSSIRNRLDALRVVASTRTGVLIRQHPKEVNAARWAFELIECLEHLREDESESIELCADNVDNPNVPRCCVVAFGAWTEYVDREFRADSILECLRLAVSAKAQYKDKPPP